MKHMSNWIHQQYVDKVGLENIARTGQLSRSERCRYFKRILKTTPLNYVTDYRIQKATVFVLHKQSDTTVTNVTYQVGFNSTSYFMINSRHPLARRRWNLKKVHEFM